MSQRICFMGAGFVGNSSKVGILMSASFADNIECILAKCNSDLL